ncbi:MAG: 6-phospho-beta-glucosidase [Oscillospiraceae bacterium]|jgi:6-phospho-beta-glucosidase|nr:6-phospho-beta-glucosidase [Oscillospiraceae bacterium]
MPKLKAAVIGAGSTYTPELIEGFIARKESLPWDSVALMDIDPVRLETVGGLAKRQLKAGGYRGELTLTRSADEAVEGASFVFAQIRVGKMAARIRDEKIPLKYGLLGQETTGAGGFMNALRTVPVIMELAESIRRNAAPDAWLINFSNPSGIIAEAVLNRTALNMVGLCNCPVNMLREVADTLGTSDFTYEYVGLNHLSWITSVVRGGDTENLVGALSGKAGASMKNVPEIEYDKALLRAVPYIPSSYLSYFYTREQQVQKCLQAEKTRGEICQELDEKLMLQYADTELDVKPPELSLRGGALYSTAAVSAADSILNDKGEIHVVAAKNNGAVPFMDDSDAVEVRCALGRNGVAPQPVRVYNEYISGLMRAVKAFEKLTVRAATEGDRSAALAALMAHPLIGDYDKAAPMLDEMLEANRDFLPRFFV